MNESIKKKIASGKGLSADEFIEFALEKSTNEIDSIRSEPIKPQQSITDTLQRPISVKDVPTPLSTSSENRTTVQSANRPVPKITKTSPPSITSGNSTMAQNDHRSVPKNTKTAPPSSTSETETSAQNAQNPVPEKKTQEVLNPAVKKGKSEPIKIPLYFNDDTISNGSIWVLSKTTVYSQGTFMKDEIQVLFEFGNTREIVVYDLSDIQNLRKDINIPKFFIFNQIIDGKIKKDLRNRLLSAAANLPMAEKHYLPNFEYTEIGDRCVFNAAGSIINAPKMDFYCDDLPFRLAPYNITSEIVKLINKFVVHEEIPSILLPASFVPYVLPLISPDERSRYDPVFVVLGESGMFKTELCKLVTEMYRDKSNPSKRPNWIDLNSDMESIDALSSLKNCCVFIDNLKLGDCADDRNKMDNKILKIVSSKHGVGNTKRKAKDVTMEASVFISGERFLKSTSAINRCLIIRIKEKARSKDLTWLQANRDLLLGMKVYFIRYLCLRYKSITRKIYDWLSDIHKDKSVKALNPRVADTFSILYVTIKLISECFKLQTEGELGMFNPAVEAFYNSLKECIDNTVQMLDTSKESWKYGPVNDFLEDLSDDDCQFVTNEIEVFKESLEKTDGSKSKPRLPEKFVFYDSNKGRYNVKAEHLEMYFAKRTTKCFSRKAIGVFFRQLGIIKVEGSDNTVHSMKKQGLNGRYLAILENKMNDYLNGL